MRVRTVESGNGMEARVRFHNWYGQHTDMGLVELRQRVIMPVPAKMEGTSQSALRTGKKR